MDRPNLTVLTHALVTRITFEGTRATGVEMVYEGKAHRIRAGCEVVLSLGAIHTAKVLLQSGIGDQEELQRFGIPIVQHLPGVGQNFQDHVALGCIWEYPEPLAPHNTGSEATLFWKSDPDLDSPDLQVCQAEIPIPSAETAARFNRPQDPGPCSAVSCRRRAEVESACQGQILSTLFRLNPICSLIPMT
jgi:choline dehydrogenase